MEKNTEIEAEYKIIFIIPDQEMDSYGYRRLICELEQGWGIVDSHYKAEDNGIYFLLGREVQKNAKD